jgi:uncharacterized protein involved in type VI secretion and phage assembly
MRTGELSQKYHGHFLATVVDIMDPDKLGRVRVEMDQFADTMDDPVWVSVSRPAAGAQQGVFFTPKIGDQVVLAFVYGDVSLPMIVGYAHSDQKQPAPIVGPQQHGIVTTIGSVIFDEQNKVITVTYAGPIPSTIQFTSGGINIQGAGTVNIQAPNVVINGRVVAPQSRPI